MGKKFLSVILIFFILFTFYNCYYIDKNNKKIFLFYLKNYYYAFEENKKIYNTVRNNLLKQFFHLKEIKLNSIASFANELENKNKYQKGIIFLDENFSSLLIKSAKINLNSKGIKLLTYNLAVDDINFDAKVPVFNITFNKELLYKEIFYIMQRHSKEKKTLSDCGIIINPDFEISKNITGYFNKNNVNPIMFESFGKSDNIDEFLKDKNFKIVIFFGYGANEKILNLSKADYKNTKFIEVITEYYKGNNIIDYNIAIDWEKAINYGLNSRDFFNFINKPQKINYKNNIYNYIINRNVLVINNHFVTIYDKIK